VYNLTFPSKSLKNLVAISKLYLKMFWSECFVGGALLTSFRIGAYFCPCYSAPELRVVCDLGLILSAGFAKEG
jgi:hypothetical protein